MVRSDWGGAPPMEPPQEWSGYSAQGPCEADGSRHSHVGAIVGIVAGVIGLVVVGVFVYLLASGTIGLTSSPKTGEDAAEKSDAALGVDLSGTVFDLSAYERDPDEVEGFLADQGLELTYVHGQQGSVYTRTTLRLSYDGSSVANTHLGVPGDYLAVAVEVDPGSTEIAWGEDGSVSDYDISLSELADDAVVTGVAFSFESDVDPSAFPDAVASVFATYDLPRATWVSASSSELLEAMVAELGILGVTGNVTDYIGDVVFVDSDTFAFNGLSVTCRMSLMGGDEFSNMTSVNIEIGTY